MPKAEPVAPGMFVASLISAVLGNILPGPGTLYRGQTLTLHERVRDGEELISKVTVKAKEPGGILVLTTEVRRVGDGTLILEGEARVEAPKQKIHTASIWAARPSTRKAASRPRLGTQLSVRCHGRAYRLSPQASRAKPATGTASSAA